MSLTKAQQRAAEYLQQGSILNKPNGGKSWTVYPPHADRDAKPVRLNTERAEALYASMGLSVTLGGYYLEGATIPPKVETVTADPYAGMSQRERRRAVYAADKGSR